MPEQPNDVTPRDKRMEAWERIRLQRGIQDQTIHTGLKHMFLSIIMAGQNANRALFLLCGGGAVAMLAFLGQVFNGSQSGLGPIAQDLSLALSYFVFGCVLATACAGLTYLIQTVYDLGNQKMAQAMLNRPWPEHPPTEPIQTNNGWMTCGHCLNGLSILLWITAFTAFIWGCCIAGAAIKSLVA